MFALLENGPLEEVPTLADYMATAAAAEQAAHEAAAREAAAREAAAREAAAREAAVATVNLPPAAPTTETSFGYTGTGETMGAVPAAPTPPAAPAYVPPPMPVTGSGVQIPAGPPVVDPADVPVAAAEEHQPDPATPAEPNKPFGGLPEYTKSNTMQMLQEISFLEE